MFAGILGDRRPGLLPTPPPHLRYDHPHQTWSSQGPPPPAEYQHPRGAQSSRWEPAFATGTVAGKKKEKKKKKKKARGAVAATDPTKPQPPPPSTSPTPIVVTSTTSTPPNSSPPPPSKVSLDALNQSAVQTVLEYFTKETNGIDLIAKMMVKQERPPTPPPPPDVKKEDDPLLPLPPPPPPLRMDRKVWVRRRKPPPKAAAAPPVPPPVALARVVCGTRQRPPTRSLKHLKVNGAGSRYCTACLSTGMLDYDRTKKIYSEMIRAVCPCCGVRKKKRCGREREATTGQQLTRLEHVRRKDRRALRDSVWDAYAREQKAIAWEMYERDYEQSADAALAAAAAADVPVPTDRPQPHPAKIAHGKAACLDDLPGNKRANCIKKAKVLMHERTRGVSHLLKAAAAAAAAGDPRYWYAVEVKGDPRDMTFDPRDWSSTVGASQDPERRAAEGLPAIALATVDQKTGGLRTLAPSVLDCRPQLTEQTRLCSILPGGNSGGIGCSAQFTLATCLKKRSEVYDLPEALRRQSLVHVTMWTRVDAQPTLAHPVCCALCYDPVVPEDPITSRQGGGGGGARETGAYDPPDGDPRWYEDEEPLYIDCRFCTCSSHGGEAGDIEEDDGICSPVRTQTAPFALPERGKNNRRRGRETQTHPFGNSITFVDRLLVNPNRPSSRFLRRTVLSGTRTTDRRDTTTTYTHYYLIHDSCCRAVTS